MAVAVVLLFLPAVLSVWGVGVPNGLTLAMWALSGVAELGGMATCWAVTRSGHRQRRQGLSPGNGSAAAALGLAVGWAWVGAVALAVYALLVDPGQVLQFSEAVDRVVLEPAGRAADRALPAILGLAAGAATAGLVGLSITATLPSRVGDADRERLDLRDDLFEYTVRFAVGIFIGGIVVAALPNSAAKWQGVIGGPLLIMTVAVGLFLVFVVRGIRTVHPSPEDSEAGL